jgi:hypothetical protein
MFYSGKNGNFSSTDATPSTVNWPARTFDLNFTNELQDKRNFLSLGKNENLDGFDKCVITARGPLDTGKAITAGVVYTFAAKIGGTVVYSVPARVSGVRVMNDATGKPEFEITAESNGDFDAELI